MVHILDNLPYFDEMTDAYFDNRVVRVKAYQIIVWMSLTRPLSMDAFLGLDPPPPRFPAVLDTGLSHNFLMREEHLREWANQSLQDFSMLRQMKVNGVPVPLYEADLWLHHNRPGSRDDSAGVPPFQLEVEDGIGVYPQGATVFPSLPTLGLRAIDFARLHLSVNGDERIVSMFARERV